MLVNYFQPVLSQILSLQLALYVYYTVYMFCAMPKEKNVSMLSTFVPNIDVIYAGNQKARV